MKGMDNLLGEWHISKIVNLKIPAKINSKSDLFPKMRVSLSCLIKLYIFNKKDVTSGKLF